MASRPSPDVPSAESRVRVWPALAPTPGAAESLSMKPLQDLYPDDFSHCYGCGRLNADGLHVKSEWHDGEAVARFQPAPQHIALPGFVYGGLIASLIDCHAMATAAAASMEKAGGDARGAPA